MNRPRQPIRSLLNGVTVHPGRVLLEKWMRPFELSQNELARMMDVSARRVNEIVNGRRAITADSAVRLSDALGMGPHYWLALQADYEIHRTLHREPKPPAPRRPIFDEETRRMKRQEARIYALHHEELEEHVQPAAQSYWNPPPLEPDGGNMR